MIILIKKVNRLILPKVYDPLSLWYLWLLVVNSSSLLYYVKDFDFSPWDEPLSFSILSLIILTPGYFQLSSFPLSILLSFILSPPLGTISLLTLTSLVLFLNPPSTMLNSPLRITYSPLTSCIALTLSLLIPLTILTSLLRSLLAFLVISHTHNEIHWLVLKIIVKICFASI